MTTPAPKRTPTELLALAPIISTRDGFIDTYLDRLPIYKTAADAYWSVEHDHMPIFGRTKYNGHQSFASVFSRWNNRRRSNQN